MNAERARPPEAIADLVELEDDLLVEQVASVSGDLPAVVAAERQTHVNRLVGGRGLLVVGGVPRLVDLIAVETCGRVVAEELEVIGERNVGAVFRSIRQAVDGRRGDSTSRGVNCIRMWNKNFRSTGGGASRGLVVADQSNLSPEPLALAMDLLSGPNLTTAAATSASICSNPAAN